MKALGSRFRTSLRFCFCFNQNVLSSSSSWSQWKYALVPWGPHQGTGCPAYGRLMRQLSWSLRSRLSSPAPPSSDRLPGNHYCLGWRRNLQKKLVCLHLRFHFCSPELCSCSPQHSLAKAVSPFQVQAYAEIIGQTEGLGGSH